MGQGHPGLAPGSLQPAETLKGGNMHVGLNPNNYYSQAFEKQLCHQLQPHVRCESREERAEAVAGAGSGAGPPRRGETEGRPPGGAGRDTPRVRATPVGGVACFRPEAPPGSPSLESSSRSGEPVQYACQHFNPSRGQEARTSRLQRAWAAIVRRQNRSLTGSRGFPTCDFKGIPRKWKGSSRKCYQALQDVVR